MKRVVVLCLTMLMLFTVSGLFAGGKSEVESTVEEGKREIKAAAILVGNVENPYTVNVYSGAKKAAEEAGIPFEYSEAVDPADYERVVREYFERGFNILFSDMSGYHSSIKKAANEYDDVAILVSVEPEPWAPNVSIYDAWFQDGCYLAGYLAGLASKTGVIGAVGSYMTPDVVVSMNGYIEGAKAANPDVVIRLTNVETWFDPPKVMEATFSLIEAGADHIIGFTYGVDQACQERGVFSFATYTDNIPIAPDNVMGSVIWDFYPAAKTAIDKMIAGTYVAEDYGPFSFMKQKGSYLLLNDSIYDGLDDDVRKKFEEMNQKMISGAASATINHTNPIK
jgi:basic membrane protein A and related proteins